jgi:hypothetical protein
VERRIVRAKGSGADEQGVRLGSELVHRGLVPAGGELRLIPARRRDLAVGVIAMLTYTNGRVMTRLL